MTTNITPRETKLERLLDSVKDLLNHAEDELQALKVDIERFVKIVNKQAAEIERLRGLRKPFPADETAAADLLDQAEADWNADSDEYNKWGALSWGEQCTQYIRAVEKYHGIP